MLPVDTVGWATDLECVRARIDDMGDPSEPTVDEGLMPMTESGGRRPILGTIAVRADSVLARSRPTSGGSDRSAAIGRHSDLAASSYP